MADYTEEEKKLILGAKQQERMEILDIIDKFVRQETLPNGEVLAEIKVPPNHLRTIIISRGEAEDTKLAGELQ